MPEQGDDREIARDEDWVRASLHVPRLWAAAASRVARADDMVGQGLPFAGRCCETERMTTRAGQPAQESDLIDVEALVAAFYSKVPDVTNPDQ